MLKRFVSIALLRNSLILTLLVACLTGCGGGGQSTNSSTIDQPEVTVPEIPGAVSPKNHNVNKGYKGALHYAGPTQFLRHDVDSGMVETVLYEALTHWVSRDGELIATVDGSSDDGYRVSVFDSRGFYQFGFDINGGAFDLPRISPDGSHVALDFNSDQQGRGIAVYAKDGKIVRRFLDDGETYYNSYDWKADGSLILVKGRKSVSPKLMAIGVMVLTSQETVRKLLLFNA